jgi:hypothetical protein
VKIGNILLLLLLVSCSGYLEEEDNNNSSQDKVINTSKVMSLNEHCLKGCNYYYEILKTSKELNPKSISLTIEQLEDIQDNCLNSCVYKVVGREEIKRPIEKKEDKEIKKEEPSAFEDEELVPFEKRNE